MAANHNTNLLQSYYSRIYRRYDLINSLFTFGRDKKWRDYTVQECLALSPSRILDLCCGTGDLAISLCMKAPPETSVIGYDLNAQMLGIARQKAEKSGASVKFIQGNAAAMPFNNLEFDCVTIGFGFRNLTFDNPNRDLHISEIQRVLKTGGSLLILESSRPKSKVLRWMYSVYLKYVMVPLGGILSGHWNAYRYLAGSASGFYTFEQLKELLQKSGFDLKMNRKFLFGSANLLIANKTTVE
jgi:demethylmenaquinone methyltransferase/2-methoxy-6-polyprenyl-1,4-benzoquinol methylase